MNRKTLLPALTGVMGLSGAIVALAPNYVLYMVGRALIGIAVGGFWSMSAATTMRPVPTVNRPCIICTSDRSQTYPHVRDRPLRSLMGALTRN
jgi:predicted MFS family arabinose efflux permease